MQHDSNRLVLGTFFPFLLSAQRFVLSGIRLEIIKWLYYLIIFSSNDIRNNLDNILLYQKVCASELSTGNEYSKLLI